MHSRFIRNWIILFIWLAIWGNNAFAQREVRVLIALNNAAQYYQKGEPGKALQLLEKIYPQFPEHPQLNYYLAILYLHYLGDKVGAEEYFHKALKHDDHFINPQLLTPEQIAQLFQPVKINEQTINLSLVLKRINQLFERGAFIEARNALKQAEKYIPEADIQWRQRFYLAMSYTYMQLDSLFPAAYYFSQIQSSAVTILDPRLFNRVKDRLLPFLQQFQRRYHRADQALQLLSEAFQKKNFEQLHYLIALLQPIIPPEHPAYFPLKIYQLQLFVAQRQFHQGLQFYQNVRQEMEKAGVFENYQERMADIQQQLTIQEIQNKVGNTSARADSLMLHGKYKVGLKIYMELLHTHRDNPTIQGFLYYQLAKTHLKNGQYDLAEKFLASAESKHFNASLLTELRTDIWNARSFEEEWLRAYHQAKQGAEKNQWQVVKNVLLPLLSSPYLRDGLKSPTLVLLASAYRHLHVYSWAILLLQEAIRYSPHPDNIKRQLKIVQQDAQNHYFVSIPQISHYPEYMVSFQMNTNAELQITPLYKYQIFGKGQASVPMLSYTGGSLPLKGGKLYRIVNKKKTFWQRSILIGGVFALTQFYLSFR